MNIELNPKIQSQMQSLQPKESVKTERVAFRGKPVKEIKLSAFDLYKRGLTRRVEDNTEKFLKNREWYVRLSNYFSHPKFQGDIANVVITGLGTGIVAPLMIKNNPLSKEDQDTKTYAAWRQPISAVIAVISQVGITKQVGLIIKKLAASGSLGKEMDSRISAKDLKRAEMFLEQAEFLSSLTESPERADLLRSMAKDPNRAGLYPDKTGSAKKIQRFLNNKVQELEIKLEENKAKNKIHQEKLEKKISDLLKKTKTVEKNIQIRELEIKLKQNKFINKFYRKNLEKKLSDLRKSNKILEKNTQIRELQKKLKAHIANKEMHQEHLKKKISDLTKEMETPERANNFILEKAKHYSDIAEKLQKRSKAISTRVSKFKDIIGIGIALVTLPVACGLLNWTYPRFMKIAFPDLSSKKNNNKQEANSAVARETKPAAKEIKS